MPLIVDAHQHLWDIDALEYAWLTPDAGPIHRTFGFDELEPQLDECGVDRTVLVQAEPSLADTDSMLAQADAHPRIAAVVGWVPLLDPEATARALASYGKDPRYVGVRHQVHDEPDPDWILRPAVQESLGLVAADGLTWDQIATIPRHLEHVPTLAEAFPELRIVIDHLAKPPIAGNGWQPWATLLARAGEYPNVYAKLSGLDTAAAPDWTADDLRRYVDHGLAVFGPGRLMWGSDWPVSVLGGGYRRTWDAIRQLIAPEDRAAILGGTASAFYRFP
ncbi:amidohydrolase family protein [Cryptosporangium phraense]|uniref:Amidohydrolase family protein n=1 Tax=Cryptosporangium phraense TaxID=2593070 RepID=A0A545AHK4_9ACTN|nr:amidohydrolase family protein [Cryptosporangium phraense]TQS40796.1 amidohydrolase family protein [Cryptosporangium phraense]